MNSTVVTLTLVQPPIDVEYTCPWCGKMTIQDFDEFLNYNGLSWSDFPDWKFKNITCPKCGEEIEDISYEFD